MSIQVDSHYAQQYIDTLQAAANDLRGMRLIEKLKPKFTMEGDKYCFTYGTFPNACVQGFGDTAALAMRDFEHNFYTQKAKP